MTSREIFEKVKAHLLTQGEMSINFTGNCAYRGSRGMKCAVGCLIPDELYEREIEGKSVGHSSIVSILERAGVVDPSDLDDQLKLLVKLQDIHDSGKLSAWPEQLTDLETRFFREFP